MKKIITALVLTIAFAFYTYAGDTPIMGYAGCEGGFWYPESQVCCIPGEQCLAGRSAPSNNIKNNILNGLIDVFRKIYF